MPLYARLWTDILDDPKLMRAVREGAKNLVLLPWFIAFAKRADAEGRIEIDGKPADPRDIARGIPNTTARRVAKAEEELLKTGILARDPDGCYRFKAWDFRNSGKTSDSREAVAERVRKHRERKRGERNGQSNAGNALHPRPPVTDVTSKRVESREERGESKRESKEKSGVVERVSLPAGARDFGRHFYGSAPPSRKRDVKRQLLSLLNGGATLERGLKVRALSPARLEAKCREVIAEGVDDPDKAIVVLLKKLNDTSDVTEGAAAAQRQTEERDQNETARRLALAEAWLAENPGQAPAIDEHVDVELKRGNVERGNPFFETTRRILRTSAVLKAWTDAGEPVVATAGGT